jgi:enediyne biosynthesis protein E4
MQVKFYGLVMAALFSSPTLAQPVFENRSTALGLTHEYVGGWEFYVGGGVATLDCNGDLFPDLFVAGGEAPAILLRNTTTSRGGDIEFVEDTPDALQLTGVTGAYPIDVDSDGIKDLFILRVGENQLLRGGPDCSFGEFPASLGFSSPDKWSTAFSATWEAGQNLPTLAVGNYVDRKDPEGPFEACDNNMLYRPQGLAYATPLALSPGFCALSILFSDWGRDGRQDLRVSNDRHYYVNDGSEQMWAMEPELRLYGEADNWQTFKLWGMGIASRDITGDGIPELMLSSMGDQKLQSLDVTAGGPRFVDATFERGTTAQRPYMGDDGRPSTGWQTEFGDVQNDGLADIFIAKGNVEEMPSAAMKDPNNLLVQGRDGQFTEMGGVAGIGSFSRSRGASFADLNLDGLLDLVVVNRRAPLEIYQNRTLDTGNWLLLDVAQEGANPDAIGGWIEIAGEEKNWFREITIGGGHASGSATLAHFGLGDATNVQIRMVWPDGKTSDWQQVSTNRILQVRRTRDGLNIEEI